MIDRKSVIASPTEEKEEAVEKEEEEAYNGAAVVSETRMHARNSDTECAHYYFIPTESIERAAFNREIDRRRSQLINAPRSWLI